MSRVSHLPKAIPSKDLPFRISIKGSITGHQYSGDFVVTVPQARQMSQLGLELARLNDGVPFELLDKNTAALNNAIAFLKVCLKDAPGWFINSSDDAKEEGIDYGLDTMDVNVPIGIFRQANDMINEWHKKLQGQPVEGDAGEFKA